MELRKAMISDINRVAKLFNAYRIFYEQDTALEQSTAFIRDRLENQESVIFVAIVDEKIVGFTQLYPLFSSTRLSRTWLLNDLYVDSNYRGRQISKGLIRIAQEYTLETGALSLSLETAKDNFIGNALYPTMGFIKDRAHNYYYWTP